MGINTDENTNLSRQDIMRCLYRAIITIQEHSTQQPYLFDRITVGINIDPVTNIIRMLDEKEDNAR